MNTVAVLIFVQGLVAVVPQLGNGLKANHMTALVLDSKKLLASANIPQDDSVCYVPHIPILAINTSDADCQNAGCKGTGATCKCDLTGQEISITPDAQPTPQTLNGSPTRPLPFDVNATGDIAYTANLKQMQVDLPNPVPTNNLVARMTFPFASVTACNLVTRRDENVDNVHPLNFRRLHDEEAPGEVSQALAQVLVARFDLQADAGTPNVTVTLTDFGGANPRTLKLQPVTLGKLQAGLTGFTIGLGNDRPHLRAGAPCEDGIARDYALFYELAQNPPSWLDRLIPHVKDTQWKSARDLDPEICHVDSGLTPMSRPVCPFATVN